MKGREGNFPVVVLRAIVKTQGCNHLVHPRRVMQRDDGIHPAAAKDDDAFFQAPGHGDRSNQRKH
jgi:hypothetical protein